MVTYRCTREMAYLANCPGRYNKQARQGHYKDAHSEFDARRQMCEDFPEDNGWFTVDEVAVLDSVGKVAARIMGMGRSELEAFYFDITTMLYADSVGDGSEWDHNQEWECVDICSYAAEAIHKDIHNLIEEATPNDTDD